MKRCVDDNVGGHRGRRKSNRHSRLKLFLCILLLCVFCIFAVTFLSSVQRGSLFHIETQPPYSYGETSGIPPSETTNEESDETTWCLILVNKWNSIPSNYKVQLTELSNGQKIDERIYAALQKMFDAARSDGIYPVVVSGYRTTEMQQQLMDEKIRDYKAEGHAEQDAVAKAEAWVAIPGTSEHQLGIAVDINADGIHSTGKEVYDWLAQNAHNFGFICRYPSGKTEITGVINEPWHYRYVGIKAATDIYNQGVCLEEYLEEVESEKN